MTRGVAFLVGAGLVWALLALDVVPPPRGATKPCGCEDEGSEADPWPEGWPDPAPA